MKTLKHGLLLAGIAGFTTFGLVACGARVLDYRNAEINNAKIMPGATTPLSPAA
jgi:hypothetical protein